MLCRGRPLTRIHYLWAWWSAPDFYTGQKYLAESGQKVPGIAHIMMLSCSQIHSKLWSFKLKPADVKKFLVFSNNVGLRNMWTRNIWNIYEWVGVECEFCQRYLTKCLDLPFNILTDLTYCYQTHSCQILTFPMLTSFNFMNPLKLT